ncbi:MAG: hypothetical protein HQL25_02990 [Candidatus Omnitrophica bacterium]|nr:hypothetical protein [Candidatus Omnitrophota bacterium]
MVEEKLKKIFYDALEIEADEIKPDAQLAASLGIDSTELVELTVAIKKGFNLDIPTNTFKKTQSFNEIIAFLKTKGV